ncbi:MAG TPA: protein kinase [Candidatus Eremiobacteraeota bacterium]|nr:MAG: Serine/threonine-protein kinase PknL [bacterium ADurb.Bin363]HPZ08095.1 protein kinase [Candidatus Eremiobacteraeota bacterium]
MSEFVPNLVLDEYAFLMEVELGGWSKFSRGFQGRDVEGNYYVLELMSKKRRGIDALLKLRQKTILNCLDIKQTKDGKWIQIYEYFPGETLRDLMETGEGFSLLDIAIICIQICNGLMAIHELNLIHEDLRPENILINSQGEVKLKGILISELMVNYVNLPEMWNYVAPEQISKSVWVNPGPASNAFSLGSIMYEILTGKKYGKSIQEIKEAIKDARDPLLLLRSQIEGFTLSELPEGIPHEFTLCMSNSLVVDPETRMDIKGINGILATFINKTLSEKQDGGEDISDRQEEESIIEEEKDVVPPFTEERYTEPPEEKESEPSVIEEKKSEPSVIEERDTEPPEEKEPIPPAVIEKEILKINGQKLSEITSIEEDSKLLPMSSASDEELNLPEKREPVASGIHTVHHDTENEHVMEIFDFKEDKIDEQESSGIKEFIPSVSGSFFAENTYEFSSPEKETEDSTREHTYQISPAESFSIAKIFDYIEQRIETDSFKELFNKLDLLIQEIRSIKRNTSEVSQKIYSLVETKESTFKDNLLLNETRRMRNSLSYLFSLMDEIYSTGPSLKTLIEPYVEREMYFPRSLSEDVIMDLMNINRAIEKATDLLNSSKINQQDGTMRDRFFELLYNLLKTEFDNMLININNGRDLEILLEDGNEFLKAIESLRMFNLILKK